MIMARVGFRRMLPMLFSLMHLALLIYAFALPDHTKSGIPHPLACRPVAFQEESVQWVPSEPKPLTRPQKLAMVFNLPAFLVAIPIAAVLVHGSDTGLLYGAPIRAPYLVRHWTVAGWTSRLHSAFPVVASHSPQVFRRVVSLFSLARSFQHDSTESPPDERHVLADVCPNFVVRATSRNQPFWIGQTRDGRITIPPSDEDFTVESELSAALGEPADQA